MIRSVNNQPKDSPEYPETVNSCEYCQRELVEKMNMTSVEAPIDVNNLFLPG
jgi:hypothetical protein